MNENTTKTEGTPATDKFKGTPYATGGIVGASQPGDGWTKAVTPIRKGYEGLHGILIEALDQAQSGKGAERHNLGLDIPFEHQRMQQISELVGSVDGMVYQACKKLTEGVALPTLERQIAELYGVINYTAGIIVFLRKHAAGNGAADAFYTEPLGKPCVDQTEDEQGGFTIDRRRVYSDFVDAAFDLRKTCGKGSLNRLLTSFGCTRLRHVPFAKMSEFTRICDQKIAAVVGGKVEPQIEPLPADGSVDHLFNPTPKAKPKPVMVSVDNEAVSSRRVNLPPHAFDKDADKI